MLQTLDHSLSPFLPFSQHGLVRDAVLGKQIADCGSCRQKSAKVAALGTCLHIRQPWLSPNLPLTGDCLLNTLYTSLSFLPHIPPDDNNVSAFTEDSSCSQPLWLPREVGKSIVFPSAQEPEVHWEAVVGKILTI